MEHYTKEMLEGCGYTVENAKIIHVDLSMADHGVLCLELTLNGNHWGCVFGGRVIGKGYLGAEEFEGSPMGIEYLMRIMDVVGVSRFNEMKGKYVRVVTEGAGSAVKIIGNIIEDKWFDSELFFMEKNEKNKKKDEEVDNENS